MQELEDERLVRMQACPLTASIHWNPKEDTKDDSIAWLKGYNKIPYHLKMGLVREKTEEDILNIAKKFNLYRAEEVGEISRIIRDSFLKGEFDEKEVKRRIIELLKLDEEEVQKLLLDLFKLRKQIATTEELDNNVNLEKGNLLEILKKFPEIQEQLIGERKIKVSGEDEFKKQSIDNWLDDYTLEKGSQPHSNLERSNYIFNSKNVDQLTFEEKKQLSSILEAYDQESEVTVDTNQKKILFNFESTEEPEELEKNIDEMVEKKELEEEKIENFQENQEIRGEDEVKLENEQETEQKIKQKDEFSKEITEPKEETPEELKKEEKNKGFFEITNLNKEKTENKEQKIVDNIDKIQSKHIINLKDI
jgi:hypothetical protein